MEKEIIILIVEIIGAAGVIASLVYLSVQIRQSNKVAKAQITKDLYLASRQAIMDIANDKNLVKIYTELRKYENEDLGRKYTFYQSFFRLYELQHILNEQGLLEENMAVSYSLIIKWFYSTEGFPEYWESAQKEFNPDFVRYVKDLVKESKV
jgi:hypothetical protein